MSYKSCVKLLGLSPQPGVLHAVSAAMVIALAIVGSLIVCLAPGSGGGGGVELVDGADMASVSSRWITVGSGDTLWGIARQYGHHEDVREDVRVIVSLNGLESEKLHPGQRLQVP